jgi:DNA-binding CsgD family transcriptional regulator
MESLTDRIDRERQKLFRALERGGKEVLSTGSLDEVVLIDLDRLPILRNQFAYEYRADTGKSTLRGSFPMEGKPGPDGLSTEDLLRGVHPDDLPFVLMVSRVATDVTYAKENYPVEERAGILALSYRALGRDGCYAWHLRSSSVSRIRSGRPIAHVSIVSRFDVRAETAGRMFHADGIGSDLIRRQLEREWAAYTGISTREREVLERIVEGLSSKMIAGSLGISVRTVDAHRRKLMRKLKAGNAVELVTTALSHHLIRMS